MHRAHTHSVHTIYTASESIFVLFVEFFLYLNLSDDHKERFKNKVKREHRIVENE